MYRVLGYYRRDGTYVRPHMARNRGSDLLAALTSPGTVVPDGLDDRQDPNWVRRNKLLAVLLLGVVMVLSEPAYASLLPSEVHSFLEQEEGPAAFCMALVAAVTAAMAVNNSKKD